MWLSARSSVDVDKTGHVGCGFFMLGMVRPSSFCWKHQVFDMSVLKDGLKNHQHTPNILLGSNIMRHASDDIMFIWFYMFPESLGGFPCKILAALPSTHSCGCCAAWIPGHCVFSRQPEGLFQYPLGPFSGHKDDRPICASHGRSCLLAR